MAHPILSVQNLTVALPSESGTPLPVVRGVSLEVHSGEFAAIVGESGCGKSMTAMALTHLPPTDRATLSGSVLLDGLDLLSLSPADLRAQRGRGISYVFQDPQSSLNPVLSVRTQLLEALPPGLSREDAQRRLTELLELVRIADPERVLRSYPHELSGGLQQRVGIAMAVAASPRLLVADEPTTALDATTQKSVLDLLHRIRCEQHIAILLITHNLGLVARYADTVHVMYAGEIVESGRVPEVLTTPLHPYTKGLLQAVPTLDMQTIDDLKGIRGRVPMPSELCDGCAFAPRCDRAEDACKNGTFPLRPSGKNGHTVACRRAGFTLLEVISVMLILMLLGGFVAGQAKLAKVNAEESRARADLGMLHSALERYHSAVGHYPSSAETERESGGPEGTCILTNLTAWTKAPSWMLGTDQDGVFSLENFLAQAEENEFRGLDPWSRPYRYYHDPDTAPDIYRLFSYGPADPKGEHPDRWIFFEE